MDLSAPATVVPRRSFDADLQIAGLTPGDTAYVTVSAVDVGILNITEFETPDPQRHYFGQRDLGVEMRDLYGRLIQGGEGQQGRMRSGGDARMQLPAWAIPGEVLMAEFSGLVQVGADGRVAVPISVPDFNGRVRVTALAWTKTALGSASKDVIVRDSIVVSTACRAFWRLATAVDWASMSPMLVVHLAPFRCVLRRTPALLSQGRPIRPSSCSTGNGSICCFPSAR